MSTVAAVLEYYRFYSVRVYSVCGNNLLIYYISVVVSPLVCYVMQQISDAGLLLMYYKLLLVELLRVSV